MKLSIDPNKTKAILIGISEYQHFTKIKPAISVIDKLQIALEDSKILGLPKGHILPVRNKRHDEIEEEIADFVEDTDNRTIETLILYYVGHGYRNKKGDFFLTGINSKKSVKSSMLPYEEIKEKLEDSHLQQCIIILDACYSGSAAMSDDIDDLDVKGSYILTSSGRLEKSHFDPKSDTTYFSEQFLNVLNQGVPNKNTPIDLQTLYKELENYHEKATPKRKSTLDNLDPSEFFLFHNQAFDEFETLYQEGEKLLKALKFEEAKQQFQNAFFITNNKEKKDRANTQIAICRNNIRIEKAVTKKIKQAQTAQKRAADKALKTQQRTYQSQLQEAIKTFIQHQKGQWNTLQWLNFKEKIYHDLCAFEERPFVTLLEKERERYLKMHKTLPNIIETPIGNFIYIKGGTFLMGSPPNEVDRIVGRELQHLVKLSDFYIGETTVTQKQWKFVMGNNPSFFTENEDCPVEQVSWNDTQDFIKKVKTKLNLPYAFRLPTEAEWEYACRAGTTTPFNTGNNLTTAEANYDGNRPYNNNPKGNYLKKTTPVGSYPPNAWGLYDMHGNVWEWCADWYNKNYYDFCKKQGIIANPKGVKSGESRVLRGGSWTDYAEDCRSAYNENDKVTTLCEDAGFRLVFSSPAE